MGNERSKYHPIYYKWGRANFLKIFKNLLKALYLYTKVIFFLPGVRALKCRSLLFACLNSAIEAGRAECVTTVRDQKRHMVQVIEGVLTVRAY